MTPQQIAEQISEKIDRFQSQNQGRADRLDASVRKLNDTADQLLKDVARLQVGAGQDGSNAKTDLLPFQRGFFANVYRRPVSDGEIDHEALKAYGDAFPHYLRRGGALSGELQASMRVGSDPDGGFWCPPEMAQRILSRLFETSPMRQLATVQPMSGDHIEFPTDPNDATSGGWVGETQDRDETDTPKVGMQSIYAREQYAMPKVTQKLLDDAAFDIEGWLVGKIVSKLTREENASFVTGSGVTRPRGFLSYPVSTDDDGVRPWGVLQYVATGQAGGFPALSGAGSDADSLIDLQLKVKPEYLPSAVWAMKRVTAAVIRKLKDKDGRYLWIDSLTEGGRPLLLGHAVRFFEDMPAVGSDALAVAFGDFSHYAIFDHRVGVRILRDNLTQKGFVLFYATKRVGGDVLGEGFDSIKLLKFAAS